MINKVLTIARNAFTETIRQPVYAVIIVSALFLFLMSPSLTMYSMSDDNKLLREIGLSTLFLSGLFIAIFAAAGAVTEEIETKTITTVLTKPVQRPLFILGKFFGVSAAVILAHYIGTIALLLTMRHGVMETASDTHDWTVITVVLASVGLAILLTAFLNYFYDWTFTSTAITLGSIFSTIGVAFLAFIDRDWQLNPANNGFAIFDIYASILLLFAVLVLVSLALALSARFNIVITLTGCIGVFMLGLISDYVFGRLAQAHIWAKIAYVIVPNFQPFWISDAIYEGNPIPFKYVLITATYAICYTAAILFATIAIFQRRQVG
ncbi:MAG: ABC transporter permease subunit [Sedimentisphaerales bacterium]|nr:ABC transporter permease subunit [Sedimentisphaerales bacterium]